MLMQEIVWIIGTSSAGKQTFITKACTDKDLAGKFGWQDKTVAVCKESVDYPGDISMPEIVQIREQIPTIVQKLADTSDVILIKWQYIDSYRKSPQKLKKLLPEANHRIILLVAPSEELEARLNNKDWWHGSWKNAAELVTAELKMIDKFVAELRSDFEITTVESGKNEGYKVTEPTFPL